MVLKLAQALSGKGDLSVLLLAYISQLGLSPTKSAFSLEYEYYCFCYTIHNLCVLKTSCGVEKCMQNNRTYEMDMIVENLFNFVFRHSQSFLVIFKQTKAAPD